LGISKIFRDVGMGVGARRIVELNQIFPEYLIYMVGMVGGVSRLVEGTILGGNTVLPPGCSGIARPNRAVTNKFISKIESIFGLQRYRSTE
jgi:hypothetical protein